MTDLKTVTDDRGDLWIHETDCDAPPWFCMDAVSEQMPDGKGWGLSVSFLRDLCQHGCASGAYMPAVLFTQAKDTMARCGDDVITYIWENLGEVPPPETCAHPYYSAWCSHWVSMAVELWAGSLLAQVEDVM